MAPDTPLLHAEHLEKTFSGRPVVNGLSLQVFPGQIVGLLGPNGAGKTTAFYMAMGLIRPDAGRVFFGDQEVTKWPIHKRATLGMGYLAQEPSVFRHLSVEENILAILQVQPLSKKERADRLEMLLAELHLTHLRHKKAATLSGGERRRVEITRALVTNPKLLLLDEPFANIDPISVQELKELIRLLASRQIGILITDHNAREIFSLVDQVYLMFEGKVLCQGPVEELVRDPQVRKVYLGEAFEW